MEAGTRSPCCLECSAYLPCRNWRHHQSLPTNPHRHQKGSRHHTIDVTEFTLNGGWNNRANYRWCPSGTKTGIVLKHDFPSAANNCGFGGNHFDDLREYFLTLQLFWISFRMNFVRHFLFGAYLSELLDAGCVCFHQRCSPETLRPNCAYDSVNLVIRQLRVHGQRQAVAGQPLTHGEVTALVAQGCVGFLQVDWHRVV